MNNSFFKKIFLSAGVFVLLSAVLLPAKAIDSAMSSKSLNYRFQMENLLDDNYAIAYAAIGLSSAKSNLQQAKIEMTVEGLNLPEGYALEGWLADEDSGYKLSLGSLEPGRRNKQELTFEQLMVNLTLYDKLVITKEILNDLDPNPAMAVFEVNAPSAFSENTMRARLSGDNEVPSNDSRARGDGKFTINTKTNTLEYEIDYRRLKGEETGAHIHGLAATGENAGVLLDLPPDNPKTGVWNYPEELESDILNGKTYINIHSAEYPDGEIRGQILP